MAGKLAWTGLAITIVGMYVGIGIISAPTTISRDLGGLLITAGLGVSWRPGWPGRRSVVAAAVHDVEPEAGRLAVGPRSYLLAIA